MSGPKVSLCLGTLIVLGLVETAEAALCQFDIGWNSRYTAFVTGSGVGNRYAYITPLTATWKGGEDPTLSGLPKTFETYCLDLGNTLHSGQWWESGEFPNPNEPPGNPIWKKDGIYKAAWLYNEYSGDARDATMTGAALQLAIWEVLYEDTASHTYDVTGGTLKVYDWNPSFETDHVAVIANAYLSGLPGENMEIIKRTWWNGVELNRTSTSNQDLIGPAPVPEPATYVAGALLVLPFLTTLAFRRLKP